MSVIRCPICEARQDPAFVTPMHYCPECSEAWRQASLNWQHPNGLVAWVAARAREVARKEQHVEGSSYRIAELEHELMELRESCTELAARVAPDGVLPPPITRARARLLWDDLQGFDTTVPWSELSTEARIALMHVVGNAVHAPAEAASKQLDLLPSRPITVGDVIDDDGVIGVVAWVGEAEARVVWVTEAVTVETLEHVRGARECWEHRKAGEVQPSAADGYVVTGVDDAAEPTPFE